MLLLLSIVFSLSNCVEETAIIKKESSFFDLKNYFETQQAILSKLKRVIKIATIDGKHVEKELDSLDFNEELKVFEASDINKVAWMDKYQVDSIFDENGMLDQIVYKATDEKLRTQQLSVSFDQNEVDTIEIFNNSSSGVAKLQQHLLYIPNSGYRIESTQKTTFSEEHVVTVDVQFLK